MLCLTTRMAPAVPSTPEERLKSVLEVEVPGIILGPEVPRSDWAAMIQEIRGAQYFVPAIFAPSFEKSWKNGAKRSSPSLDAEDSTEAQFARDQVLDSLMRAEDLSIPYIILTPPRLAPQGPLSKLHQRHMEWAHKRNQLHTDLSSFPSREDPQRLPFERELIRLQAEYVRFVENWRKQIPPVSRRRNALLRNLDKILDEADRRQVSISLREGLDPETPCERHRLEEIFSIFDGAPLSMILDPVAAWLNMDMQGLNDVPAFTLTKECHGIILSDLDDLHREILIGEKGLHLWEQYHSEETPLSLPLHILDPHEGTLTAELRHCKERCRELGLDGLPPPEPGEPFKIF